MRVELEDMRVAVGKARTVVWANEPTGTLGEAAVEMARLRNMFDAVECEVLGAFDASKEFRDDGDCSASAWVAHRTRSRRGTIQRRTHAARRLRSMPHSAAAFAAGEISLDHVEVLAKANLPSLAGKFATDEERLAGFARRLSFADFCRAVRYWRDIADPDEAEKRALAAFEARELHLSQTFDGMGRMDGWNDPVSYQELKAELDRRTEALLEQEWADARARLGDLATVNDLERTPGQRRHDALIEMARRSRAFDGPVPESDITTTIVVDHDTYITALARLEAELRGEDPDLIAYPENRRCEFADGTIVTPEQALSMSMAGYIRGLILDENGHPLNYGRKRRFFQGPQREAAMLAFATCDEDGCEIRSPHCQIDHVLAWVDGGLTDSINAKPRCKSHNLWKERLEARERRRRPSP